jgi:hypothetical protein
MRYFGTIAYTALAIAMMLPFAGGTWLLLRITYTQSIVKQIINSGIDAQTLIVLDINHEEEHAGNGIFIRIHSREFIYRGQMYDVVSVQDFGQVKRYLVYPDLSETRLKRKLARKMNQNGSIPLSKCLERINTLNWLAEKHQSSIYNPITGNHVYASKSESITKIFVLPEYHPPESAV